MDIDSDESLFRFPAHREQIALGLEFPDYHWPIEQAGGLLKRIVKRREELRQEEIDASLTREERLRASQLNWEMLGDLAIIESLVIKYIPHEFDQI